MGFGSGACAGCYAADVAGIKRLSAELIGVLAVGVALAGLILTGQANTDARLVALDGRLTALEARMGALEQRQARLEGLIEGAALFSGKTLPDDG